MPTTPALVAVDLDGTVVRHGAYDRAAGAATVTALAAVRAAGVPIVVVTARPRWDSSAAMTDLGIAPGHHVFSEGAVVTGADGLVAHRVEIDPGAAIRGYLASTPAATFSLEISDDGWLTCENYAQDVPTNWKGRATHDVLAATPTTSLTVRVPCDSVYAPSELCSHAQTATDLAGLDPAVYRAHIGRRGWVSVVAAGTDKASGLARVAASLGVARADVVAFGDSRNDLPMLAWAGLGVAMGQAPAEVRDAADEVAPPVEDDGVAAVLGRWFRV
ncbi:MAG TPA: HAD family hydrolase [Phytomonospora sp.]